MPDDVAVTFPSFKGLTPSCARESARSRLRRMCGICGIACVRGQADLDRLGALCERLVHGGLDSFGEYVAGPVAIASRRFSVTYPQAADQTVGNEGAIVDGVPTGDT